jgi:hypothetical protein
MFNFDIDPDQTLSVEQGWDVLRRAQVNRFTVGERNIH